MNNEQKLSQNVEEPLQQEPLQKQISSGIA